MALPPRHPAPPAAATQDPAATLAAQHLAAAKALEHHVDLWMRGQGARIQPGQVVIVPLPIVREEAATAAAILGDLSALYTTAGWREATTAPAEAGGPGEYLLTLTP